MNYYKFFTLTLKLKKIFKLLFPMAFRSFTTQMSGFMLAKKPQNTRMGVS